MTKTDVTLVKGIDYVCVTVLQWGCV